MPQLIALNRLGDVLVVNGKWTDESRFFEKPGFVFTKIGEHQCRSYDVYLYELESCHMVVCPEMALRIPVPKEADTHNKLQEYLEKKISEAEYHEAVMQNHITALKARG